MSKHQIRFVCSPDADPTFIDDWLPQYLTNLQAWEAKGTNDPPELIGLVGDNGDGYWAEWWFDWAEDEAVILDQIEEYASSYTSWYVLSYHVCDHDADEREGCVWDETLTGGDPPEDVVLKVPE